MNNFFIIFGSVVFSLLVVSNLFNAKNIKDNARLIEDLYDRLDSLNDNEFDDTPTKNETIKEVDLNNTIHFNEF